MTEEKEIPFYQEILRKLIHLASLSIPIFYSFFGSYTTMMFILPMTFISLFVDVFSRKGRFLEPIFNKYFGSMMRAHEKSKFITLNGASWVLLSACFVFVLFPKYIAITGFSILIISDGFAAIVGRSLGRIKFLQKSLEGSMAFILSAALVVFYVYKFYGLEQDFLTVGLWAAIATGIVEALSKELGLDDNIAIPMTFGWIMVVFQ